jgi:uncharacterized protein
MRVTVVWSPSGRHVAELELDIPAGTRVAQALELAKNAHPWMEFPADGAALGVWNQPAEGTTQLIENDRIEIYRPLAVDPKEARRLRFGKHKSAVAGLFAKRHPSS